MAELLAEPVLDRERLLNDTVNTGVMAALIGGFALSTMQMGMVVPGEAAEQLTVVIYMLSVVSVRHGRDSALAHTAHARTAIVRASAPLPAGAHVHVLEPLQCLPLPPDQRTRRR